MARMRPVLAGAIWHACQIRGPAEPAPRCRNLTHDRPATPTRTRSRRQRASACDRTRTLPAPVGDGPWLRATGYNATRVRANVTRSCVGGHRWAGAVAHLASVRSVGAMPHKSGEPDDILCGLSRLRSAGSSQRAGMVGRDDGRVGDTAVDFFVSYSTQSGSALRRRCGVLIPVFRKNSL